MADVTEVILRDHLTAAALKEALSVAEAALTKQGRGALLVDASRMTGYDQEARAYFVSWNSVNRKRIVGVGIVTTNRLWVMIISAMSLASGQKMKAFDTAEAAAAWCRDL